MEQKIKCPRCDSLDTKFCYYNNHSERQPRYLCKACKRHWTQGGALKDVPIGGGSRPRKPKITGSSSSSSISMAAPLPLQSLPQDVVQNQWVCPNPISEPFNQPLNGGVVNIVDSSDLALQNQWICSLPFSLTHHQGSGGGAGAWYLSALVGDHSPNASSQVPLNQSQSGGGVNDYASPFNESVSPSLPITNTYHQGSASGGAQAKYFSYLGGDQSLNASSQVPLNQSQSGGGVNDYASPFNESVSPSLPITNTYHQGSASGGAQAKYFSYLGGDQSLNASSQVPFNQSQNSGGVNSLVSPFNELVSHSLPITNTYHRGSVGGGAQTGNMPVHAGIQSFNASLQVPFNQPLNGGGGNVLVSSPLTITNTYHDGSAGGGAQNGYVPSLAGFQPLNLSSQSFNQSLDGVAGSSYFPLLSSFITASSNASVSQGEIESTDQGSIQPNVDDNNIVAAASHYPDHWPQSCINSGNNVVDNEISLSTMFDITTNITIADQNFYMPNHGSGLRGYGAPPQHPK